MQNKSLLNIKAYIAPGNWALVLHLLPGSYHYKLIVDGEYVEQTFPQYASTTLCLNGFLFRDRVPIGFIFQGPYIQWSVLLTADLS